MYSNLLLRSARLGTYEQQQKSLKDKGIESMLDDARKMTKETDADYNRR